MRIKKLSSFQYRCLTFWRLKSNKSPGIDGLRAEFYKTFKQKLAPVLTGIFETCLQDSKHPPSWTESKIILIHKVGKDPMLPQSYHPISLLNTDYKVFTSVLATRLNKILCKYIHQTNQVDI